MDLCRMPVFCAYGNELGQFVDHASDFVQFSELLLSNIHTGTVVALLMIVM